MSRLSRSFVRVLGVTALLSAFPVGSVLASSSTGAQTVSQSSCDESDGTIWCRTERAVYQVVETPNGNRLMVTNLKLSITATYSDGHTYSSEWSLKENLVMRHGETQEYHIQSKATSVDELYFDTCISILKVHYANGAVQFESLIETCG